MPVYHYVIRTSLPSGSVGLRGEIDVAVELSLKEVVEQIGQETEKELPLLYPPTLLLLNQARVDLNDDGDRRLHDGDTITVISLPLAGG